MDDLRSASERLRDHIRVNQQAVLGPMLRHAAAVVFAAQLGLAGCAQSHTTVEPPPPPVDGGRVDGGGPDGGGPDGGGWTCGETPGLTAADLEFVREELGLDYLALLSLDLGEMGGFGFTYSPALEAGAACDAGAARERCLEALEVERSYRTTSSQGWNSVALATRGEQVIVANQISDLADPDAAGFFALSSPEEAALAALLGEGVRSLECGVADVTGGGPGGWELTLRVARQFGCGDAEETLARYAVEVGGAVVQGEILETRTLYGYGSPCVGRRPAGMNELGTGSGASELGEFWGSIATLEAAAVIAFENIATELRLLGAPEQLIAEALEARDDEVRHAEMTDALALRHGATPARATTEPFTPRSLFDFALDNATEGCVRETYGALYGEYQSIAAADPAVQDAMREIAADETRHATLSWRIAAWAESELSAEDRERIRTAQREAIEELYVESQRPIPEALAREAGVPRPAQAKELLDSLRDGLWN